MTTFLISFVLSFFMGVLLGRWVLDTPRLRPAHQKEPCDGRERQVSQLHLRFKELPPPPGWVFSHCPIETDDEETDPCAGCPGWGHECGAMWRPRANDTTCTALDAFAASERNKP